MSTIWQKSDGKCHHCKEDLNIDKSKGTVGIPFLGLEFHVGYICKNCEEMNAWQDPNLGKIWSFMSWIGRKYW